MAVKKIRPGQNAIPQRGRPQRLDYAELHSNRDSLFDLVDRTWAEVGWKFRKIKTPEEVPSAFRIWEQETQYVVTALLRSLDDQSTAKVKGLVGSPGRQAAGVKLMAMQRRLSHLNEIIGCLSEEKQQCNELLELVDRTPTSQLSKDQHDRMTVERVRLADRLAEVERRCLSAINERQDIDQTQKNAHAYFARAEFFRFCKSPRYKLNPQNVANALAGVPFIGWRQSAKICGAWNVETDGPRYAAFKAIKRVIESCKWGREFIDSAEQWLRDAHSSKSDSIFQLQWNWYYLKRSMETVEKRNPPRRQRPYVIASEYVRMTQSRSPVDILLESRERITRKTR